MRGGEGEYIYMKHMTESAVCVFCQMLNWIRNLTRSQSRDFIIGAERLKRGALVII